MPGAVGRAEPPVVRMIPGFGGPAQQSGGLAIGWIAAVCAQLGFVVLAVGPPADGGTNAWSTPAGQTGHMEQHFEDARSPPISIGRR